MNMHLKILFKLKIIKKKNTVDEKKRLKMIISMLEKRKPSQRTQMILSCKYLVLTFKNITEKIAMW